MAVGGEGGGEGGGRGEDIGIQLLCGYTNTIHIGGDQNPETSKICRLKHNQLVILEWNFMCKE